MELATTIRRNRTQPGQAADSYTGGARAWLKHTLRAGVESSRLGERLFWRLPESCGDAVALTFDDGPDPEQTPRLLDILGEYGAHATFFLLGSEALRYPDLVSRIQRAGHTIGNHTHTHARCRKLGPGALRRELAFADIALRVACPELGTPVFRPPFGELSALQSLALTHSGRRVIFWSKDSRDYRGASAGEIAQLGGSLQSRDIALLHDRFSTTLEALPELLRTLQDRGLRAVAFPAGDV